MLVVGPGPVEVRAADRAQAGAVVAADDLTRQRQREGVARPRAKVEIAALQVGRGELVAAAGLVDLARIDLDVRWRRLEAALARPGEIDREGEPHRVAAAGQ